MRKQKLLSGSCNSSVELASIFCPSRITQVPLCKEVLDGLLTNKGKKEKRSTGQGVQWVSVNGCSEVFLLSPGKGLMLEVLLLLEGHLFPA